MYFEETTEKSKLNSAGSWFVFRFIPCPYAVPHAVLSIIGCLLQASQHGEFCWKIGGWKEEEAWLFLHLLRVALGDVSGSISSISSVRLVCRDSSIFRITPAFVNTTFSLFPSSLRVEVASCCCQSLTACLSSQTFYHP